MQALEVAKSSTFVGRKSMQTHKLDHSRLPAVGKETAEQPLKVDDLAHQKTSSDDQEAHRVKVRHRQASGLPIL